MTEHAGQSRLLLTLTHAASDLIKSMVTHVRKDLDTILEIAPQLKKRERWTVLVRYIVENDRNQTKELRRTSTDEAKILATDHPGDWVTEEFRLNI